MGLLDILTDPLVTQKLGEVGRKIVPESATLRSNFPRAYGFLGGLLGTAPDQMGGSVLDPNTQKVREGAGYGFPVGTALSVAPIFGGAFKAAGGPQRVGAALEKYAQKTGMQQNIFIGPSAKTWDSVAAAKAQQMADAGTDARQIWSETGTWKGPDGKWRQEIPDNLAKTPVNATGGSIGINGPIEAAYIHPDAYKAYPQLKNIEADVEIAQGLPRGAYGTSTMDGKYLGANIRARGPSQDALNSTLAHEIQHGIQDIEGFARGGSSAMSFSDPEAWKIYQEMRGSMNTPMSMNDYAKQAWGSDSITQEIADAYKKYAKQIRGNVTPEIDRAAQETAAKQYYKRLAGEAEARATQARLPLDAAQRRATFPEDSYDLPMNQLIIRGLLGN